MKRPWWSRLLCWVGSHDWRNMDGVCASCGWHDPLWDSWYSEQRPNAAPKAGPSPELTEPARSADNAEDSR